MDLSGAVWHKSARSGANSQCGEVATNLPDIVAVRDSKSPNGPVLTFTPGEWRAFVEGMKDGEV